MTTLGPRAVHLPPIPAPTRPNLLSSVGTEPRPSEGRWQAGIAYQPPRYAPSVAVAGSSADPCGEVGDGDKTITDSPASVSWDPYIIWAGDQCATLGDLDEVRSRAEGQLEAQTSHLVESILWTNQVDGADFGASHPNASLADASVANGGTAPTQAQKDAGYIYMPNGLNAFPLVTAFRDLTDAMTEVLGGVRGMIHVEKRIVGDIAYAGLAVQNGQRLLSTLGDHVVVPGTGYTGSDPEEAAASAFHTTIYATSMVEVLLSPIEVFGSAEDKVNRSTNNIEVRAERMALAHWDRQCHIAVTVCLEDPFGDCSDAGS